MSLLNDMLRDLAAQQHTPTAPRPLIETLSDGAELSHGDSPMGFMHAQWVWSLLIFLVLVGAVLIFKYTRLAGDVVENPRAQVVAPQKASVVFTPTTVDSTPVVNLGAPKKTEIKSSQNTLEIVKLLVMAQRAFDRDRLTSPIEDNAYSYYQRILDSDKNNRLALEGVSAIAERYLAMTGLGMMEIDEEWPENKIKRAELYINRAESVSPKSSLLAEYKNKLALIVSDMPSVVGASLSFMPAQPLVSYVKSLSFNILVFVL